MTKDAPGTLEPSAESILEVGLGFMRSKTLLSAVELDLFTTLGDRHLTGAELQRELGLHERANPDFFVAHGSRPSDLVAFAPRRRPRRR